MDEEIDDDGVDIVEVDMNLVVHEVVEGNLQGNLKESKQPGGIKGTTHCGARRKHGRGICTAPAMENGRCRTHGGKTPKGIASPHFKHGAYSKYFKLLPGELQGNFAEAIADPELLSLKDDIGLLTARIMDRLTLLTETVIPPWGQAATLLNSFVKEDDSEKAGALLDQLGQLLNEGAVATRAHEEAIAEIRELIQEKTKTATAEWKRLNDLNGMIPIDQVLGFAKAFLIAASEVIKLNAGGVVDQGILRQIQEKTLHLLPPE